MSLNRLRRIFVAIALVCAPYAALALLLRYYDAGSQYQIAVIAATGTAVSVGVFVGAHCAERRSTWRSRSALVRCRDGGIPFGVAFDLATGVALAGLCATLAATLGVWCVVASESAFALLRAFVVQCSVSGASAAIAFVWSAAFGSLRTGALFAAMTWVPVATAFMWMPLLVAPSKWTLELALNANPLAGVFSALDAQKILWNPGIYDRLPYAEHGALLWSEQTHFVGWFVVAAVTVAGERLMRRLPKRVA